MLSLLGPMEPKNLMEFCKRSTSQTAIQVSSNSNRVNAVTVKKRVQNTGKKLKPNWKTYQKTWDN